MSVAVCQGSILWTHECFSGLSPCVGVVSSNGSCVCVCVCVSVAVCQGSILWTHECFSGLSSCVGVVSSNVSCVCVCVCVCVSVAVCQGSILWTHECFSGLSSCVGVVSSNVSCVCVCVCVCVSVAVCQGSILWTHECFSGCDQTRARWSVWFPARLSVLRRWVSLVYRYVTDSDIVYHGTGWWPYSYSIGLSSHYHQCTNMYYVFGHDTRYQIILNYHVNIMFPKVTYCDMVYMKIP